MVIDSKRFNLPDATAVQPTILIVEDDAEIAQHLGEAAVKHFDQPAAALASSLCEANAFLDERTPRIAIVDMLLPDGDGGELLLRLDRDGVPAFGIITGAPSLYRATLAVRTRAADFLAKPFTADQLTAMFDRLSRRLREHDELSRLREQAASGAQTNEQLRLKIDILCKDLVGGYQKLVDRLVPQSP